MNTLKISNDDSLRRAVAKINTNYTSYVVMIIFLFLWPIAQHLVSSGDPSVGFIDPNIWLLILLSLICFMVITGLCWWLLHRFWLSLSLPDMGNMVSQFKTLKSWHQLSFLWASFALLLLTMLGVLSAIL